MNIHAAKKQIQNAIKAYLSKNEFGEYEIPPQRQRPVLLMGPPGIGKTAIMEQIAQELGILLLHGSGAGGYQRRRKDEHHRYAAGEGGGDGADRKHRTAEYGRGRVRRRQNFHSGLFADQGSTAQ